MEMESIRFFVAGLNAKTSETDLRHLFQDYGNVLSVDLKAKKNQTENELEKIIAFVTIKIHPNNVRYCLNELNNSGHYTVTQAKESFLERLKREREQTAAGAIEQSVTARSTDDTNASELLRASYHNTKRVFGDDEELDDADIDANLLITKKRAANSLRNGKIIIESIEGTPIHIINNSKKMQKRKSMDKKALTADQKRKESLNKMKSAYQQQKSAIQAALDGSTMTDKSRPNKSKFHDSDEDENDAEAKANIFDSADEEEDNNCGFNLNEDIRGKKASKLAKMKSEQQSADPRFRLDAKFVDEEADDMDNGLDHQETDERDWQMGILEEVVGTKISQGSERTAQQNDRKHKRMLHYDPDKKDHEKLLRNDEENVTTKVQTKKSKSTKHEANENELATNSSMKVSKEVFYNVTDTLTQSLKARGTGFSLLNMFGTATTEETIGQKREEQLKLVANEKILILNKKSIDRNKAMLQPFADSDEDATSEDEEEAENNQNEPITKKKLKDAKKVPVKMESFFVPKNDARLKDGAKFFLHATSSTKTTPGDYEVVRNHLKFIIKTKIAKTKKQLAAAGVRGTNKRRRF